MGKKYPMLSNIVSTLLLFYLQLTSSSASSFKSRKIEKILDSYYPIYPISFYKRSRGRCGLGKNFAQFYSILSFPFSPLIVMSLWLIMFIIFPPLIALVEYKVLLSDYLFIWENRIVGFFFPSSKKIKHFSSLLSTKKRWLASVIIDLIASICPIRSIELKFFIFSSIFTPWIRLKSLFSDAQGYNMYMRGSIY